MTTRQENKEKKQAAILAAALSVFSEKGFAAAKIIDIATAANVGKGTIYEYFRSKDDLFFALCQWYADQTAAAAMVSIQSLGGSVEQRLCTLIESLVKAVSRKIDTFTIFLEFWAAATNPLVRDRYRSTLLSMYEQLRGLIISLVDEGRQTGIFREDVDPVTIAAGVVGAMDGMLFQEWMDRDFHAPQVAHRFIRTLVRGMRA